jgi:hypothetical protein
MAQPSALFLYNGVFVLDLRLPIATALIRLSFVTRAPAGTALNFSPLCVARPRSRRQASFLLHRWVVPLDERD